MLVQLGTFGAAKSAYAKALLRAADGLLARGAGDWPMDQRVAALVQATSRLWGAGGADKAAAISEVAAAMGVAPQLLAAAKHASGMAEFGDFWSDLTSSSSFLNPINLIDALKGSDPATLQKLQEQQQIAQDQAKAALAQAQLNASSQATSSSTVKTLVLVGGGLTALALVGALVLKRRKKRFSGHKKRRSRRTRW